MIPYTCDRLFTSPFNLICCCATVPQSSMAQAHNSGPVLMQSKSWISCSSFLCHFPNPLSQTVRISPMRHGTSSERVGMCCDHHYWLCCSFFLCLQNIWQCYFFDNSGRLDQDRHDLCLDFECDEPRTMSSCKQRCLIFLFLESFRYVTQASCERGLP